MLNLLHYLHILPFYSNSLEINEFKEMFVTSNKSQSAPIPALSRQLDHDFSDLNFIPVFIDLADEDVHGSTDPID